MSHPIKAVLVSLSITQLSRKKTDKEKTRRILDEEHADEDAGEWKNALFPRKAFKERYRDGTVIDQLAGVAAKARANSFNFRFTPLPQSHHYITSLAQESLSALRSELEARNQELMASATARLKEDIIEPFKVLVERLAQPENRRFGPIVTEIGRVCERAKVLNLANDASVTESVAIIQDLVGKLAPNPEALQDPAIAGSVREMGTQIIQHFGQLGARKLDL